MPRVNLNKQDLNNIIECLNDSILRTASDIKIRQLDSLKTRLVRARDEKEQEQKSVDTKKSKRSSS